MPHPSAEAAPGTVRVRVRVPPALRALSGGRPAPWFDLGEAATVDQLLDAVAADHPALERRIRDEQGALRPHVNLFLGDENIRSLAGAATVLAPGDEVTILAAISGG
ncbi:MAG: MoaD/ThiS family protein [Actinomycetota bacterium]|nr:MoaD/ThiS family protein [Actinomycetota bacterium]